MRFFLIALVIGAAAASPAKTKTTSPPNCSQISRNCAPKYSSFCSSYNKVKPTTTTATVSTGVATTTSTFTAGTTTTTITASTCGAKAGKMKLKRANTNVPTCLHATGPTQISAACSCLATASTATQTTTVATSTTTATSTVMVTATYTALVPPACPTVTEQGSSYHNYADACGVTENGNNPGGSQVFVSHYPGNVAVCAAISSCASAAASKTSTLGVLTTVVASSFDIHLLSSNQWECVAYQKVSNDPSYFNVQNNNVLAAYGYTI